MKISSALLLTILTVGVYSCKKEGNSNATNAFEDTWNFSGIHSETQAIITTTEGGDTGVDSTVSSYDSKNNAGTVKFDGSSGSAISTGVGYSIAINSLDYNFLDGTLQDTSSYIKSDTIPPSNSARGYKLIGPDSVSFTGSGLINDPENTYSITGAHYSINGNQMTLSTTLVKDSAGHDDAIGYAFHQIVNVKVYLDKH